MGARAAEKERLSCAVYDVIAFFCVLIPILCVNHPEDVKPKTLDVMSDLR